MLRSVDCMITFDAYRRRRKWRRMTTLGFSVKCITCPLWSELHHRQLTVSCLNATSAHPYTLEASLQLPSSSPSG